MRRALGRKAARLQTPAPAPAPYRGCLTCVHSINRTEYSTLNKEGFHDTVVLCGVEIHNGGYRTQRDQCNQWEPGPIGVLANKCDTCASNLNIRLRDYGGPILCGVYSTQRKIEVRRCGAYLNWEKLKEAAADDEQLRQLHMDELREQEAKRHWLIKWFKRILEPRTTDHNNATPVRPESRPTRPPPPASDD